MNAMQFVILALRKVGFRRFVEIVGVKTYRNFVERSVDKSIRTATMNEPAPFEGILPLESSNAHRFKTAFPAAFNDLIDCAQRIRLHRFQFLGATFQCGESIDWHADPITKKQWQKRIYQETSILYAGSPPDVKPVWELNRHQYFVTLAQAYHLSGDRVYADELENQWLDWIRENPFRVGINWASPLEIGLRLISWTLSFQFIEPNLTKKARSAITFSIWQQASFLSANLSVDKIVRTNHLVGEAAGLFVASSSFTFERSKQWSAMARKVLENEIGSQIFDDGAGKEQSSSYHRFDVDLFLLAYLRSLRLAVPLSQPFAEQLRKMIRWLYHVQTPTHLLPPFGDCDNGRGFLLSPSVDFWDVRGLLALGGLMLNDEVLSIPSFLNEEAFWFLPERLWNAANEMRGAPKIESCVVFPRSGHLVMKNVQPNGHDYCFFRAGPFGMGGDGFSSHSHADLFSPILYLHGELILADTGTSVYLGNDAERDYLRSPAAHNTTFPPHWDFFTPKRWFGWRTVVNGKIIRQYQTDQETTVECGFEESAGVQYRRKITHRFNEHSVSIEDLFEENVYDVHTYFHLDSNVTLQEDKRELVLMKDKRPIARCSFPDVVKPAIDEGWISKSYGTRERALVIHFGWNATARQSTVFTFTGVQR